MSVQDVIHSKAQRKLSPKQANILRIIAGQVIAFSIVGIAGWNVWGGIYDWVQTQNFAFHAPDLSRLSKMPLYILVHIVAALIAVPLGGIVLYRRKGTTSHKAMGYIWILAMLTVSVSSFFMKSFAPLLGQFGPIHVLSVWVICSMPTAIYYAKKGNIVGHKRVLKSTYIGLIIAGVMTFIPGRIIFGMFFA